MGMKLKLSPADYGLTSSSLLFHYKLTSSPSSSSSLLFNYRLTSSSSLSLSLKHSPWSSRSTTSASDYELFFPNFNREYVSNIVDWYTCLEKFEGSLPDSYLLQFTQLPHMFPDFYEEPHFMHTLNANFEPIPIQVGQHFDVISLLSTYGDDLVRFHSNNNNNKIDLVKANNLRGKYILLCCISLPSLWIGYDSNLCRLLSLQLSHMKLGRSNFEIVFVPKMRPKWDNDEGEGEGVFNHFFSAFSGCLVVPFTHKYRRDYICKSLNFDGRIKSILLDPSHIVLEDDICGIVEYKYPSYHLLMSLGYRRHYSITPSSSRNNKSLAGLLSCEFNSSSFLPHMLGSEQKTISIKQLNKHCVGLYLFRLGNHFKIYRNVYQQCKDQGLDLEVVLVCLPYNTPIHPDMFQDVVHCAMKKHQVSGWWVLPYNHSTFRRLDTLSGLGTGDQMIIVGPQNKFVEMEAGTVLGRFGLHFGVEAYPFTREALLHAFLRRLGKVTLDSFLTYEYVFRGYKCDDGERMPVSELKGKNVLVFVEDARCFETPSKYHCGKLNKWYRKIKKKDPNNFEVVFVPFIDPTNNNKHDSEYQLQSSDARKRISKSKTKWLVCPFDDPMHSQFLMKHDAFVLMSSTWMALKGLPIPSVLAFSQDGHLYSLDALWLLDRYGLDVYPFLSHSRNLNLSHEIAEVWYEDFDLEFDVDSHFGDDTDVSL